MASDSVTRNIGRVTRRVPGLRKVPVVMLISAAEVALVARDHLMLLTPAERRRLITLVRIGRGRRNRLTAQQRRELEMLIGKVQARRFMGDAISKMSPVRLPRRLVYGRRGH
jgi:hypothetical protein